MPNSQPYLNLGLSKHGANILVLIADLYSRDKELNSQNLHIFKNEFFTIVIQIKV